jgi:glycosyltransferase involved in cell wall biosynthesis
MQNILIVSAVFPPEPVVSAKISYDLSKVLSIDNRVTVLCPKPTRPFGFDFSAAINTIEKFTKLEMNSYTCSKSSFIGRLRENISFGRATAKYIKHHHCDINLVYADTWPLFSQYFIVKAAVKYKLPIVIHVQDIYPESLMNKLGIISRLVNAVLLPIDKFVLKKATSVIAISDYMRDHLSLTRKISKKKISVVLNWQDDSAFLESFNTKDYLSKFTFMYLGNIGPVAGVDLLIESFVLANIPNSRLVIAGSGSMKNELIKKSSSNKKFDIQFWEVPEGKVPEIQSKADIMLLPIKEGAAMSSVPSKLPAYMLSGKPIICCADKDSDTSKCIELADCGYVVVPENKNELSKIFIAVHKQEDAVLRKMGEKGRNYALDFFSKEVNLKKLVTIINNSIN